MRARRHVRRVVGILRVGLEITLILAATGLLVLWCSVPNTGALAEENPRSTAFIELRVSEAAEAQQPFVLRWEWRSIENISPYLRVAVVDSEDATFFEHDGVHWDSMYRAFQLYVHGRASRGGSTITQQLAKNLYLSPDRAATRKLRELAITTALERDLSKRRILELYLNVVEWGPGVFGAEAAARHWFNKSVGDLTPAEAIRLTLILPGPRRLDPTGTVRISKARMLLNNLRHRGLIDQRQASETLAALSRQADSKSK
jgi:monofunctional glycosyltransferase